MLITQRTSDGRTVVTLHKDWSPSRISQAYMPRPQNNLTSTDTYKLQSALLKRRKVLS